MGVYTGLLTTGYRRMLDLPFVSSTLSWSDLDTCHFLFRHLWLEIRMSHKHQTLLYYVKHFFSSEIDGTGSTSMVLLLGAIEVYGALIVFS
jgi:hypothetical protein